MNRSQTGGYVLKFISGKYQGGEFPLELDSEIEIGRGGELDMVLVEDMVSRRHARITSYGGELYIEDFKSTNGTFVNGEKIEERAPIKEGDRILIGTNIIKLVHRDSGVEDTGQELAAPTPKEAHHIRQANNSTPGPTAPPPGPGRQQHPQRATGNANHTMAAPAVGQTMGAGTHTGSISGLIEEVPLPDLLQLFSTSRKSGVLLIMNNDRGKVYLRGGRVYFATINDDHDLDPYKAFYRLIAWNEGTFSLEPPTDETFENEIDESVESLMMEGMRILDEIQNLGPDIPEMSAQVSVAQPLEAPLSELSPELLDTFQQVLNFGSVSDILNKTDCNDIETLKNLRDLIQKDYIVSNP